MSRSLLFAALASFIEALPLRAAPDSFAYVLQADSFASDKAGAVSALAESDRDWIVIDSRFDDETAWTPADLKQIREGKAGRKIVAYISIAEAEDYRSYWQASWARGPKPAWLFGENPDWKGNYQVAYWHPEWQAIVLKMIDEAMATGFDGIYLDIVDGFEGFEKDGNRFIDDRPNPATKQSYRRDMVDWVKKVAERARVKDPAALVIPQNGSQLLVHPDFVSAISGVGIEDLFTEGDHRQPEGHSNYVTGFLKPFQETGKPVLVIEYPKRERSMEVAREANKKHGFIWLITDRELKGLGTSGR